MTADQAKAQVAALAEILADAELGYTRGNVALARVRAARRALGRGIAAYVAACTREAP